MVMLPSTFTSTVKHRPLRPYVIGKLARVLAIFGVTHVFVYYDDDPYFDSHALGRYIVKVLKYAVTPPWLKKKAFPKSTTDRWFGLIPPLQIEAHEKESIGGWSWGVVGGRLYPLYRGRPVNPLRIKRDPYIGFWAEYIPEKLDRAIKQVKKRMGALHIIGTSKYGRSIWDAAVKENIYDFSSQDVVVVVFGGPHRGIFEMSGEVSDLFDLVVNVYPHQRTRTIRTEEAVALTLEALSMVWQV